MRVQKLVLTVYRDDGWGAQSRWILQPTWTDVEVAIHELDRFRHPFLWMYLRPSAHQDDVPDFEVLGGDGAYTMNGLRGGEQVRYSKPTGGEELVPVWTSDQGAEFAEPADGSGSTGVPPIIRFITALRSART